MELRQNQWAYLSLGESYWEWIGIDFFLFDQAVSEIFYTSNAKKWSLIESYAMVFIANPDVKKSINVRVANKNYCNKLN